VVAWRQIPAAHKVAVACPAISRSDVATRIGGHGGRRLAAATLQGAMAKASQRRGNSSPGRMRGRPRCDEEGTGRWLTVCSARRPVEAEEVTAVLHPVAPVLGRPGERVRGIERSGLEVVVLLARRDGVRISRDNGSHEAWRWPWRTRAAERGRAHKGGRRSSKRAAVARLSPARCGIGGSAAWTAGRAAGAARMHDAVVNLATVTTNSARFSAMCPLLDTLCSRFQAEPGLEHCTKDLHPPSLSTSY
jgi:hypothetical protein